MERGVGLEEGEKGSQSCEVLAAPAPESTAGPSRKGQAVLLLGSFSITRRGGG